MVEGLRHHAAAAREVRRGALQVRARAVGVTDDQILIYSSSFWEAHGWQSNVATMQFIHNCERDAEKGKGERWVR
jgi:hypothetical protein